MRSIRVFRDSGVTVFLVEQNAESGLAPCRPRLCHGDRHDHDDAALERALLADERVRASYLGAKATRAAKAPSANARDRASARFTCAIMFGYPAKPARTANGRTIMAMNRRKFVGAGMGAAALPASSLRLGRKHEGPIKIGVFGPMSGNAAAQGQSIREAVELVVNLKNSAGGILGRQNRGW